MKRISSPAPVRSAAGLLSIARDALSAAMDNGLLHFARSTSYSALLCIVPVTTTVAALLSQVRAESSARIFTDFLQRVLPPGTADAVLNQVSGEGKKPQELLFTALIFSIFAASTVLTSLMDAFNAAYSIRSRSFLRQQMIGVVLVFLCAVPLVAASIVILFGDLVASWLWNTGRSFDPSLHPIAAFVWFSQAAHFAIAFAATIGLTALLYRFAPNRRQKWRAIWPGAGIATMLWLLLTLLFRWYVRNISNYNVLYGSVGVSMALLTWMYLLFAALLIGCEFNAALERAAP